MLRLGWIAAMAIIADQISKWLALTYLVSSQITLLPVLKLVLVFNRGAAFGFLDQAPGWQNGLFIAIAITVVLIVLFMIRRLEVGEMQVAVALWLVIGGALGNLVDRIRIGAVVDFIQVTQYFPVFNVADSAITLGAILLAMDAFGLQVFGKTKHGRHGKD